MNVPKCANCNEPAVVSCYWVIGVGPQRAELCEAHARYVQDRLLAKEASDIHFSSGLTFSPVHQEPAMTDDIQHRGDSQEVGRE